MNQEPNNYSTRSDERYRDVAFSRKEALKLCQPGETGAVTSGGSFIDDALAASSENDRLRARRHLHDPATHHDRERSKPDKQAYVEEEDPETGALHRWEPESDKSSVHGRAGGVREKLASRPKQDNRILSQESVTTNNEARKHHEKARVSHETDRHTVHRERHRDTLEDHGLTKDYIESWLSRSGQQSEKRTRKKMMAQLDAHINLQKLRQENAACKAARLASLQSPDPKPIIPNDMSSSRRAMNTPKDNKPGASIRTRTEASSTSSTSHVSRDQGEDSHKNFDSRQTYAHRASRDFHREEEERKREEIQENHRKWYKDCREKAARDAAAFGSVQTSRPQPNIANGMSSSRSDASHPKYHKPSAPSRARPQVSPIKSTPDALSVRSAGSDHTTIERKTVVKQSPSIYNPVVLVTILKIRLLLVVLGHVRIAETKAGNPITLMRLARPTLRWQKLVLQTSSRPYREKTWLRGSTSGSS